jgi:hypothetical protein
MDDQKPILYSAPIVVLALHHNALQHIDGVRTYPILKHLCMEPLLRLYAIFPVKKGVCWFSGMPHTVTDSPIRYIIPIDSSRGIVMISYTDGDDARYWMKQHHGTWDHVQERVMHNIRQLFTDTIIPDPIYFKAHEWRMGCTYWLPGNYDVKEASQQSLYPMPEKFPGLFMCGESFAEHQCWMESALEQADHLLHHSSFIHQCKRL